MEMLPGSAALLFDLQDAFFIIRLRAFGDSESVRKAMSAACSHRHSIIITHGPEYVANVVAQLGKLALDNVSIFPGSRHRKYARTSAWKYHITLEGKNQIPHIRYHSLGKDVTFCPMFQFLRVRYRRPYEWTEARKRNKGGRPKESWLRNDMWRKIENLTPAVRARYERLSKARAAKARKREEERRQITKQADGKALGLKDRAPGNPKRIVSVDFSNVVEDMRAMSRLDMDEMDPEYEHELDRLYGTESGQQP